MFKKFFRNEVIVPLKYTEELKAAYSSGSVTGGKLKKQNSLNYRGKRRYWIIALPKIRKRGM